MLRDLLECSPGYEDLGRLGLMHRLQTDSACLRVSLANAAHDLAPTYPAAFTVPRAVTDETLRRLAKTHRQHRLPAAVWRCSANGALLFRAAGFQGKSLAWASTFGGGGGGGSGGGGGGGEGAEVSRVSEEQVCVIKLLVYGNPILVATVRI